MISPKEKTRSPMATAAWLTLLGPPSRWTVHHIAATACTLKLRWRAFWFPRSSWHLVFEFHLVGILPVKTLQTQFHLFSVGLVISQDGSHSPLPPWKGRP